jgi:hypothetical protein
MRGQGDSLGAHRRALSGGPLFPVALALASLLEALFLAPRLELGFGLLKPLVLADVHAWGAVDAALRERKEAHLEEAGNGDAVRLHVTGEPGLGDRNRDVAVELVQPAIADHPRPQAERGFAGEARPGVTHDLEPEARKEEPRAAHDVTGTSGTSSR